MLISVLLNYTSFNASRVHEIKKLTSFPFFLPNQQAASIALFSCLISERLFSFSTCFPYLHCSCSEGGLLGKSWEKKMAS